MNEQTQAGGNPHANESAYTPFDPVEEWSQRRVELLCVATTVIGLYLRGGQLGLAAGLIFMLLWARLKVEFVLMIGALLYIGLGGYRGVTPLGSALIARGIEVDVVTPVLVTGGVAGLLAIDIAHTWQSVRPVFAFVFVFLSVTGTVVFASASLPLLHLGGGFVIAAAVVSYGVHRYERTRFTVMAATVDDGSTAQERDGTKLQGSRDGRTNTAGTSRTKGETDS